MSLGRLVVPESKGVLTRKLTAGEAVRGKRWPTERAPGSENGNTWSNKIRDLVSDDHLKHRINTRESMSTEVSDLISK